MALWCDKFRPTSFDELNYNTVLVRQIRQVLKHEDFPHLLVCGADGSGKSTLIKCILRELFGDEVERIKIQHFSLRTPSNKTLDLNLVSSKYHIEINPSDLKNHDILAVRETIKNMVQNGNVASKQLLKVVVISEAHKLTREAQQALRRTMEKYINLVRMILIAETTTPILTPIVSRCLLIRVSAPSVNKVTQILRSVAEKERFSISQTKLVRISKECRRNLRRALLVMEAMVINESSRITAPYHVNLIRRMAKKMTQDLSLNKIKEIRQDFFQLDEHLVPVGAFLRTLCRFLLLKCPSSILKGKLIRLAAKYDHQMRMSNKRGLHFEAFALKFMNEYIKSESSTHKFKRVSQPSRVGSKRVSSRQVRSARVTLPTCLRSHSKRLRSRIDRSESSHSD